MIAMNKILIAFLLLSAVLAAPAKSEFRPVQNEKEVGGKLDNMAKSLQSIQSNFHQERYIHFMNTSIDSEGKFWFKKENSLRWEYTSPFKYTVIINRGIVILSDHDGNANQFQVEGNKIFEQVNNIIVAAMSGDIVNNEDFEVQLLENNDYYLVKLKPLDKEVSKVVYEMEIFFEKSSLEIAKIKMNEPSDDYTLIRYSNRKINEPIPDSVFGL